MLLAGVAFVLPLFTKTRSTVWMLVPAGLQRIARTRPPFVASAVNAVRTVPVPSFAVFAVASAVAPHWTSGARVKIGCVFAGISHHQAAARGRVREADVRDRA